MAEHVHVTEEEFLKSMASKAFDLDGTFDYLEQYQACKVCLRLINKVTKPIAERAAKKDPKATEAILREAFNHLHKRNIGKN